MRVLILSLDKALFSKKGEGDTFKRFLAYQKHCQKLVAIVPVTKKAVSFSRRRVRVLAAYGFNSVLAYWQLFWLTKKTIAQEDIDLVVTNDAVLGAIAVWWHKFYPVKVQINIFGLEIINPYWLKERPQNILLKWIQEWAIKRADGIRTDSRKEKEQLVRLYGMDPRRIVVVPVAPGQESQETYLEAKADTALRNHLLGEEKFLVLSVGSLVKAKDFPTLLKAARVVVTKIPQTVFVIAGEGPEKNYLKREIKRLGLKGQVKLLGSIAYQQLPRLFASADVFVLSSSHEGFPRVIMEAALSGRPIVSTDIDGASDLIQDYQSGIKIPVKDVSQMAKAIVFALQHPQKARKMGQRAKEEAKKLLAFDRGVDQLVATWRGLTYGSQN